MIVAKIVDLSELNFYGGMFSSEKKFCHPFKI